MIIASSSLSSNSTSKTSNNSIRDFTILKIFFCNIHQPKPQAIKEVLWHPPLVNWTKCNIDGASQGNPGTSACGGIFRDHNADFLYCFFEPLGNSNSYYAELCAFMRAIEIANLKNWNNIWIETDSFLVALASKSSKRIPWSLRNRWNNVMAVVKDLNCMATHIYREGNQVADLLTNHGLTLTSIFCCQFFFAKTYYAQKKKDINYLTELPNMG